MCNTSNSQVNLTCSYNTDRCEDVDWLRNNETYRKQRGNTGDEAGTDILPLMGLQLNKTSNFTCYCVNNKIHSNIVEVIVENELGQ